MESVEKKDMTVSAGLKVTFNLGDFNSISVDMRIDGAELLEGESAAKALDRVYSLLDTKVGQKIEKAAQEFNG